MKLTPDQQKAYEGLVKSTSRIKTLIGAAGTGKTTSIFAYVKQHKSPDILFLAPTNKAVKIIEQTAKERLNETELERCEFSTIHSALGLGMSPRSLDEYLDKKDTRFKKLKRDHNDNLVHSLVIIDECSMIDDCVLYFIKTSLVNANEIIFMGDSYQLPPVNNEGLSKTFNECQKFELTQVVRQEGDLVKWLENCRKAIDGDTNFEPYPTPETEYLKTFLDCFNYVKTELDKGIDFRVLAYTNNTVDMWNSVIKDHIFGSCDEYHPGEKIIFTAPWNGFTTSSEYTIIDVDGKILTLDNDGGQIAYQTVDEQRKDRDKRKSIARQIKDLEDYLMTVADDKFERTRTQDEIKRLVRLLKGVGRDKNNAPIRPAYALTIHNSQGSTYDKGLIIGKNIDINQIVSDRNRLWYVAASRFKYGFKYH